jgi:MFS family permease
LKKIPPWLTLLVLAPLLGELVSGHQPPLELCNPLSVILLMLPYGLGALICRELVRRWKKGWLSLALLAIAYAFYEEAIVVRSFFNPNWMELDTLKPFYVLGVNWTYAAMLVHFHVLISIGASVLLAEMLHPERRAESWLGNRGLAACIVGLALWFPAGWLMTSYVPPWPGYALSWAAIAGLTLAARFVPAAFPAPIKKKAPHPFFFLLLGLANMTLFFVMVYVLPETWSSPLLLSMILLILLDALTLLLLLRWSGNGGAWDDRHRLAWAAGCLGFFLFFGFTSDAEKFAGRSCVSLLAMLGLILMGIWLYRRARKEKPIPG